MTSGQRDVRWLKGHGTRNDFVLLPDPDGSVHADLSADTVVALCDRQRGIGADGVLRVVRSAAVPDGEPYADVAEWFMDYRNADGSISEMCGNGSRVFVLFLLQEGWVKPDEPVLLATRGGVRTVRVEADGQLTVAMGPAVAVPGGEQLQVQTPVGSRPAVGLLLPNPHAVVFVEDLRQAGPLTEAPLVTPASVFPDGVNVEFVADRGPAHVAMRVHERGVGETLSCGTGACAAAVAAMRRDRAAPGTSYVVEVRGGRLVVTVDEAGEVSMTGPAEIGPSGVLDRLPW